MSGGKKPGLIRWSYLGPRLAILALVWAFFFFALDPLLERALERGGGKALGAAVDVGDLSTSVLGASLSLDDVAAADPQDPMRNLFAFKTARFALEGRPLLEGKIVVGNSELAGLSLGTSRAEAGVYKDAPPSAAAEKLSSWSKKTGSALGGALSGAGQDMASQYKVKPEDLESSKLAGKLREKLDGSKTEWDAKLSRLRSGGALKDAEAKLAELRREKGFPRKLKLVKELSGRLKKMRDEAKGLQGGLGGELLEAKSLLKDVQKAKERDIQALESRLKLPSLDAETLSAYFIGPPAAAKLGKTLRFIEAARRKLPAKGAPPAPPEGRGRNVEFPKERSWPAFWLKKMRLSGETDLGGSLALSGTASDFSSAPSQLDAPAVLELTGARGNRRASFKAVLDRRGELPEDVLSLDCSGLPVPAFQAGDPASMALEVSPGTAKLDGTVKLVGEVLSGRIRFREEGVRFRPVFGNVDQRVRAVLGSAFEGLKVLEAEVVLGGTLASPEMEVRTNLGRAAGGALKAALGKKLEERRRALRSRVEAVLAGKAGSLEGDLAGREKGLAGASGEGQRRLDALSDKLKSEGKAPLQGLPKIKKFW